MQYYEVTTKPIFWEVLNIIAVIFGIGCDQKPIGTENNRMCILVMPTALSSHSVLCEPQTQDKSILSLESRVLSPPILWQEIHDLDL